MVVELLDDYPQSSGSKTIAVARVSGVNYTAGTPQPLYARSFGMRFIEHVEGGMSESATYVVVGAAANSATAGLHWFTASNGSEATADLSAEYVTIKVTGQS
jgi:hypothetical protein